MAKTKGLTRCLAIISILTSAAGCGSQEFTTSEGRPIPGASRHEQQGGNRIEESSGGFEPAQEEERGLRPRIMGMPNPSAAYCTALGYKYDVIKDENGNEYGVCTFPDGSSCLAWDFYRGKASRKWSYCTRKGYGIKELQAHEGWFKGCSCLDTKTGKEIGSVFDLVVKDWLAEQRLPQRQKGGER